MCDAIIRIKYLAEKSAVLVEVKTLSELKAKIDELCEKDQVVSISVFPREHDIVLTKRWEKQVYRPEPETVQFTEQECAG